jgi:hypothetical protein
VSRIRLLSAVALLVVVPLAGCAAGRDDATSQESSPRIIDADTGSVAVRNIAVWPSNSGNGTAQAYVTFTLVSPVTDTLTGVSVGTGATVTPTDPTTQLIVKPQAPLIISNPDTPTTNPGLAITGLTTPPVPGTTIPVTLNFQNAGSVTVQAPVRESSV